MKTLVNVPPSGNALCRIFQLRTLASRMELIEPVNIVLRPFSGHPRGVVSRTICEHSLLLHSYVKAECATGSRRRLIKTVARLTSDVDAAFLCRWSDHAPFKLLSFPVCLFHIIHGAQRSLCASSSNLYCASGSNSPLGWYVSVNVLATAWDQTRRTCGVGNVRRHEVRPVQ